MQPLVFLSFEEGCYNLPSTYDHVSPPVTTELESAHMSRDNLCSHASAQPPVTAGRFTKESPAGSLEDGGNGQQSELD